MALRLRNPSRTLTRALTRLVEATSPSEFSDCQPLFSTAVAFHRLGLNASDELSVTVNRIITSYRDDDIMIATMINRINAIRALAVSINYQKGS